MVDFKAKIFSISYIKILEIFISLAWDAYYTNVLKNVVPIIKISIVGSLANSFCELKMVSETQSLDCERSLFNVLRL